MFNIGFKFLQRHMPFTIENNKDYTIIKCNIEKLDAQVSPNLKSEFVLIDKANISNVIVDLTATKYCDSSGLSALLVGNRLLKDNGALVICGLQPNVRKLIEISQLHSVLNITETLEDAIQMISMPQIEK